MSKIEFAIFPLKSAPSGLFVLPGLASRLCNVKLSGRFASVLSYSPGMSSKALHHGSDVCLKITILVYICMSVQFLCMQVYVGTGGLQVAILQELSILVFETWSLPGICSLLQSRLNS